MINIPSQIKTILELFSNANYEIYLVGGYVRDSILGIESYDIDMTTSATPNVIKDILKEYSFNDEYSSYGCIKLEIDKYNIEITTFRKEYDYKDYRRPNKIEFITDLKEDLKRRDFTINALCYDGNNLIDLYNGKEDLRKGLVKAIGNPLIRFEEDALRMLRALRFCSSLGFKLDNSVINAINEKYHLVYKLNKGLRKRETEKILKGKYYKEIEKNYSDILMKLLDSERSL